MTDDRDADAPVSKVTDKRFARLTEVRGAGR